MPPPAASTRSRFNWPGISTQYVRPSIVNQVRNFESVQAAMYYVEQERAKGNVVIKVG